MSNPVVELIDAAFPDCAFADLGKASNECIYESCEEAFIEKFLFNRPWHDVTLPALKSEYLGDFRAALAAMPDDAYAYYLPAFVVICVESLAESDLLPLAVINSVANHQRHLFLQTLSFSKDQLLALKEFVWHLRAGRFGRFAGPTELLDSADEVLSEALFETEKGTQ